MRPPRRSRRPRRRPAPTARPPPMAAIVCQEIGRAAAVGVCERPLWPQRPDIHGKGLEAR
eukprot:3935055-Pyramimonas_sp.AAC.1